MLTLRFWWLVGCCWVALLIAFVDVCFMLFWCVLGVSFGSVFAYLCSGSGWFCVWVWVWLLVDGLRLFVLGRMGWFALVLFKG